MARPRTNKINEILYDDGQIIVVATTNQTFVIDAIDRDLLEEKWWQGADIYAKCHARNKKRSTRILHKEIFKRMFPLLKCDEVDHINRDKTDHRRMNIRPASRSQNAVNGGARTKTAKIHSKYKNVYWDKQASKWRVQVFKGTKRYFGGRHFDELSAARAADALGKRLHGDYYHTNFKINGEDNLG